jgi:hypothetical protein
MTTTYSVCVFCGSCVGRDPRYRLAAIEFGRVLVARGGRLVYGGGRVGLMGVVADAVLDAGGEVIGVIPEFLATKELTHARVTDMRVVDTMHARKALMAELSDRFVALPGGLGTFDEVCEILTWSQLGLHAKPIGLLNTLGYFEGLLSQIHRAARDGFCRPEHQALCVVDDDPAKLCDALDRYQAPDVSKWLRPDQV